MRARLFCLTTACLLLGVGCAARPMPPAGSEVDILKSSALMKIESPAFGMNGVIPGDYTCDGRDVSPPLRLSGVPVEAKSLVLIVDDPDAVGGLWVHWVVWNMPPETAFINEGDVPSGAVQGVTSSGQPGYGGPCPPSGQHRYFFKAYALDTALDLPASADSAALESAMSGHVLDKAGLIGTYSRR